MGGSGDYSNVARLAGDWIPAPALRVGSRVRHGLPCPIPGLDSVRRGPARPRRTHYL